MSLDIKPKGKLIMKKLLSIILLLSLSVTTMTVSAQDGNTTFESLRNAKEILARDVYNQLPNKTVYCGASYQGRTITDPNGFYSSKYKKRGNKVEWEHVVPDSHFGETFSEWTFGAPSCANSRGKPFKGRSCASRLSKEYRYMAADLYNLYPVIGTVNALRSDYDYVPITGPGLGDCDMIIEAREANPPDRAKGVVARVSLYFAETYKRYSLSDSQRDLFNEWDEEFPVTEVECKRNEIIEGIQGNVNHIMKSRCEYRIEEARQEAAREEEARKEIARQGKPFDYDPHNEEADSYNEELF